MNEEKSNYEYRFATGSSVVIEISTEWAEILIKLDNEEKRNDHKQKRGDRKGQTGTRLSLDAADFDGEWLSDDTDILRDVITKETRTELRKAISELSPAQRELLRRVFEEEMSASVIADEQHVTEGAIRCRLRKIYAQLRKKLG